LLPIGSSLRLLLLPILLYLNWEFVSLFIDVGWPNPFRHAFLLSGYIQHSNPDDPQYQKSWWDLLFLAYYIIFFAFVRQSILIYIARPLARYFGLRRPAKVDRFGEQTYALLYFAVFGAWGYVYFFSHLSHASF
jgi:acyl-CoA-dependent ceramide synthase